MLDVSAINGEKRTKNIKFQIYLSLILRGLSIFLSFFVVRITIDFLGKDLYGIWIILLSIISWLALCDIGIGNGLRNKLTIALSKHDLDGARTYISTAYGILSFIALIVLILFGCSIYFVNWPAVFNSNLLTSDQYRLMMFVFVGSIVVSFVLSLINSILNAYQQNALTNIGTILTNLCFMVFLVLFKSFFISNIIGIIALYCLSLILSNLIISAVFFLKNKNVIPGVKYYSKSKIKDILSLGGSFFIIQIAVLLIFTVDNFIVLQLLGTEQVSVYNIVFKLFSIFTIAFGIIISPLWSAFTEAKEKGDFNWMKLTIKKLNRSILLVIIGLVFMMLFYQQVLDLWLPSERRIEAPFSLIIALTFFVLISIWNNIYSFFLNGIGVVKIQVRTAAIGALINIPLAVFFVKYLHLGLVGIVVSMCISLSLFSIFGPIETYKFLKKQSND